MKLMLCTNCSDVFKLAMDVRSCECGRVRGKYEKDGHHAVTNGEGYCIALNNYSISRAIHAGVNSRPDIEAWMRPHEGEYNPRSRIYKNL